MTEKKRSKNLNLKLADKLGILLDGKESEGIKRHKRQYRYKEKCSFKKRNFYKSYLTVISIDFREFDTENEWSNSKRANSLIPEYLRIISINMMKLKKNTRD